MGAGHLWASPPSIGISENRGNMFLFHKKDKVAKSDKKDNEPSVEVDREELVRKANELLEQIDSAEGDEKCDLLERRGKLLMDAGEDDLAIDAFEACVANGRRMGAPYRSLTTLYNRKRKNAAESGDQDGAKLYLDKLQSLMQNSKDMLRGK